MSYLLPSICRSIHGSLRFEEPTVAGGAHLIHLGLADVQALERSSIYIQLPRGTGQASIMTGSVTPIATVVTGDAGRGARVIVLVGGAALGGSKGKQKMCFQQEFNHFKILIVLLNIKQALFAAERESLALKLRASFLYTRDVSTD